MCKIHGYGISCKGSERRECGELKEVEQVGNKFEKVSGEAEDEGRNNPPCWNNNKPKGEKSGIEPYMDGMPSSCHPCSRIWK